MLFGRKRTPPAAAAPRILIMDDEADICELLRLALEPAGYAVETALDGETGLARARAARPALIVLDIKMPRLNGYQVLAQLQQDAGLAEVPVIVITSLTEGGGQSDEDWTRRLNIRKLLSKPFSAEVVVEAVREILPPSVGVG